MKLIAHWKNHLRQRRLRVKQHDLFDCGPACTAAIARYHGYHISLAKTRILTKTGRQGSSLYDLSMAFNTMNIDAQAIRCNIAYLKTKSSPSIAQLILDKGRSHFVVVIKVKGRYVCTMDPAEGRINKIALLDFQKEWTGVLLEVEPKPHFKPKKQSIKVWKAFYSLLLAEKALMIWLLILSLVYVILGFSVSFFVKYTIDLLQGEFNSNTYRTFSFLILLLVCLQFLSGLIKELLSARLSMRMDARILGGVYNQLFSIKTRFFETMRLGEILSRVSDGIKLRAFLCQHLISILINSSILLLSIAVVFTYNSFFGLLFSACIPFFILVYALADRANRSTERRLMTAAADFESKLINAFKGIKTIKAFDAHNPFRNSLDTSLHKMLLEGFASFRNHILARQFIFGLTGLLSVLLIWQGAVFIQAEKLTLGELMLFFSFFGFLTGPLIDLIGTSKVLQNALIAHDRLQDIFEFPKEDGKVRIRATSSGRPNLQLERVAYQISPSYVLFKDVNLRFCSGKIYALIGSNGSGKSTFLDLIRGLKTPSEGRIFFENQGTQSSLEIGRTKLLGHVLQNMDVFQGSIVENVTLNKRPPEIPRIQKLLKKVGLDAFVESLPEKLNTEIGEDGVQFSEGQLQKLALVRCLYQEPKILILDEPCSSMDDKSTNRIVKLLKKLQRSGSTIVLSSHKEAVLSIANVILEIKEERIYEKKNQKHAAQKMKIPQRSTGPKKAKII